MNCKECGKGIKENLYLCGSCLSSVFKGIINTIKPSLIEELSFGDIFPDYMCENMEDFLIKDLNETISCLACELWTATILMSLRIFEYQLKVHIFHDLGIDDFLLNIGECIRVLEDLGYSEDFIELFEYLRDARNSAMHGERRFGSANPLKFFKKSS